MRISSASKMAVRPTVRGPLSGGSPLGVPGDPAALWLFKNGVLQPDSIGKSIFDLAAALALSTPSIPTLSGGVFYVSEVGTALKAAAISESTPMSVATFNASTFSPGDTVYFVGDFTLGAGITITIPSSGTDWANPIVYSGLTQSVLDGAGKDYVGGGALINTQTKDYIYINKFTFQNIKSSSAAGGEAFTANNSIHRSHSLIFRDAVVGGGGFAWIETGGVGAEHYLYNCYFDDSSEDEMLSNHTAGSSAWIIHFKNCTFGTPNGIIRLAWQFVYWPGTMLVEDCSFYKTWTAAGPATINRCKIIDTTSMPAGTYNFCTFFHSTGGLTNRFFGANQSIVANNCTFVSTGIATGAICTLFNNITDPPSQVYNNCIFSGLRYIAHTSASVGGRVYLNNCDVYDSGEILNTGGDNTVTKINCIAVNPLFVDKASGDYRLQANSPCRQVGIKTPYVGGADQYDLDGKKVYDSVVNLPDGSFVDGIDIGAYAFDDADFLSLTGPDGAKYWPSAPMIILRSGVDNAVYNVDSTGKTFATPALALAAMATVADDQYLFAGTKQAVLYSADMSAQATRIKRAVGDAT